MASESSWGLAQSFLFYFGLSLLLLWSMSSSSSSLLSFGSARGTKLCQLSLAHLTVPGLTRRVMGSFLSASGGVFCCCCLVFFCFFFLQLCYCCRAAVVWHGDTRMQTKISYVLSFFHFWQWPCPVTAGVSELKQADFLFKCICCLEELQSVSSLCKTGCPAACSRYTCCPCCLPFIVLDSNFLMVAATFLFEGIFLLLVE